MQPSRLDTGGIGMEQRLQALDARQRGVVWSQRIAECRSSGMTVRAWCQERNFSEKTYYYWQHRIFKAMTEQPAFAEISIASKQPTTVAATVRMSEAAVDIYTGADVATIETVLRIMRHAE